MLLSLVTGTLNSTENQSEFVQKSFLKLDVSSPKKKRTHVNKMQIRVWFICSLKVSISKLVTPCSVHSAAD